MAVWGRMLALWGREPRRRDHTSPYALKTSCSFSSLTVDGRPPTKMDRTCTQENKHGQDNKPELPC
jgi:hypothetical protein